MGAEQLLGSGDMLFLENGGIIKDCMADLCLVKLTKLFLT